MADSKKLLEARVLQKLLHIQKQHTIAVTKMCYLHSDLLM
jgi:hypothetical protein